MWILFFIFIVIAIIIIFARKSAGSAVNTSTEKPTIKASTEVNITASHSNCRFDTKEMKQIGQFFLVENEYIDIACADILQLNTFLKQLNLGREIQKSALRFSNAREISTNCHVETMPLTSTGKTPKYPQKMSFYTTDHGYSAGDDLFGDIFYLADGSIGKATIIVWNGNVCTEVKVALINGKLSLNLAYRTGADGVKTQIFKASKQP